MKRFFRKNNIFLWIELALGVIILILYFSIRYNDFINAEKRVSVIVEKSSDAKWDSFREGLSDAARDRNIQVVLVSTGEIVSAEQEQKLIDREIGMGAKAVIVEPAPGDRTDDLLMKTARSLPVLLVESDCLNGSSLHRVSCNGEQLGKAMGEEILSDFAGDISGKKIGVLMGRMNVQNARDRLEGLSEALGNPEYSYLLSNADLKGLGEDLSAFPPVDILVALDTYSLEVAGANAVREAGSQALIYGIASSDRAFYYLDRNIVKALTVPDMWEEGYEAMDQVIRVLHRESNSLLSDTEIDYSRVRRDTLFSEDKQDRLFVGSE